jgi:hypothetical protein
MDLSSEIERLKKSPFPSEQKLAVLLGELQSKLVGLETLDTAEKLGSALVSIAEAVKAIKFPKMEIPPYPKAPNIQKVEVINQEQDDDDQLLRDICTELEEAENEIVGAITKLGNKTLTVTVDNAAEIGRSVGGITVSAQTAAKATAAAPIYTEGQAAPLSQTLAGGLRISGTISAASSVHATAAAPTYVEGTDNPVSSDLAGNERVTVANFPATQPVSGTVAVSNFPASQAVTGPLTDAQLRATAVPVSGPATDAQMRATPIPISGTVGVNNFPATQVVTEAILDTNFDAKISLLAKDATLGSVSDVPGTYTVLDRLNKINVTESAIAKTLIQILTVLTPPIRPKSTTTLLHR